MRVAGKSGGTVGVLSTVGFADAPIYCLPMNDDKELAVEPSAEADSTPAQPREIGGRDGPEPTRYGDWEKNGRCIDF